VTDQPDPATQAAPAAPAAPGPRAEAAAKIAAGYEFTGPALEFGTVVLDGIAYPDAKIRVPLGMMNRHGLIAGATGTGKTKTLQGLTEQLVAAGVPVVVADIKGDLSGLSRPVRRTPRSPSESPTRPTPSGRRRRSRSSSLRSAASAAAPRCAPR
jgi:hypothetical protein